MTDLQFFAKEVKKATKTSPSGWFGDKRVFINHVWFNWLEITSIEEDVSLSDFKELLIKAHRKGYLSLSRADLVEAMDPVDVKASTAKYMGATWNFVNVK